MYTHIFTYALDGVQRKSISKAVTHLQNFLFPLFLAAPPPGPQPCTNVPCTCVRTFAHVFACAQVKVIGSRLSVLLWIMTRPELRARASRDPHYLHLPSIPSILVFFPFHGEVCAHHPFSVFGRFTVMVNTVAGSYRFVCPIQIIVQGK